MGAWGRLIQRVELARAEQQSPFKRPHGFSWGFEHLGLEPGERGPMDSLDAWTHHYTERSSDYFVPSRPPVDGYQRQGDDLEFLSTVETFDEVNNQARCRYFARENAKTVVLAVPQWNGGGASYDRMCRWIRRFGYSAAWLSLPFHQRRGDGEIARDPNGLPSTLMVSADIGLTLLSMRQAVQDVLSLVTYFKRRYQRVCLMGASIGSCVAFLAAAHDKRINGFFANLMSSFFGDVVWTGISTRHVRASVEPHLDRDDLRRAWLMNSPINFVHALRENNPALDHFVVSGRYDTTFRLSLTKKLMAAYDLQGIRYEHRVLPCGHYTLGALPFKLFDAYLMLRFFNQVTAGD